MLDPADPGPAGPRTALLLLGDGRFPAGGHVHSAGIESAVADGRVHDLATLESYVAGRLHTVAVVDAALAAASIACLTGLAGGAGGGAALDALLGDLDREATARITPPSLRHASRRLGRQLLRVASRCWPGPLISAAARVRPDGLHNAVALGVAGGAAGLGPSDVAALAIHHAVTTPAQAAVRLLGLDPFDVAALTAAVDREAAGIVEEAVAAADAVASSPDPSAALVGLPARAAPLVEIAAVEHERADMRLFAT